MNKIKMITLAAMVAGSACADLSVDWFNSAGAVSASDSGTDWLVGSTAQLVWSATDAITTSGAYDLNALETAGAFYVLDSAITGATSFWSGGGGVFNNADVGGNNINSGFFYTRVFQNDGSVGEAFLDVEMAAGGDWTYSATDPLTTFGDSAVSGGKWVGANGTTVVPEPATLGLFGLGALSAWIIRRNKLKAREEV